MKSSLKRWVGRVPDLSAVITRFPISVAAMVVFTVILVLTDGFFRNEGIGRFLVGLIISAYTCVIITLAQEGRKKPTLILIQIVLAIALSTLFWFSETLRLNFAMAVGAVLLLLGNAVRWRQSRDDLHVWDFTHKIWTGAIFAVVGSIIFTLGIFAIQAALKSLFGFRINDLTEHLLLPVGLGLLAPLYWLSTVPVVDEPYDELIDSPGFVSKAVAFLGTWLLSPLTLIYAIILIAYGVKIILAGELPKGEIAQLTTPFLLVGTLTWLVLEPPFIKTKALAKLFRKFWFPISIPAALMLAIAVFVRVQEYGFTPERVALCLIVIWSLGLGIWFTVRPEVKRDIRLVPGTAAFLLLIGSIGSGWMSIGSQYNRLENSLDQALTKTDIGFEVTDIDAAQTAKSAINYLKKENADKVLKRAFSHIDYQPADFTLTDIYDDLGLNDVKVPTRYNKVNQAELYEHGNRPVNLNGFDQMLGRYNYYFNHSAKNTSSVQTLYHGSGVKLTITKGELEYQHDDVSVATFGLFDWAEQRSAGNSSLPKIGGPIIVYENNSTKIAIQPITLQIWNNDNGQGEKPFNGNMEFYILINGLKL